MVQGIIGDHYPSDWSQLYALQYAEVCALVESWIEGTIDAVDVAHLFGEYRARHHGQVLELAKKGAAAVYAQHRRT